MESVVEQAVSTGKSERLDKSMTSLLPPHIQRTIPPPTSIGHTQSTLCKNRMRDVPNLGKPG